MERLAAKTRKLLTFKKKISDQCSLSHRKKGWSSGINLPLQAFDASPMQRAGQSFATLPAPPPKASPSMGIGARIRPPSLREETGGLPAMLDSG
jgi:hypothetical protein